MEHYVICIWNGSLSEEDHVLTNYLNTLFPNGLQYEHIAQFAEEVAVLLKPISEYIAVLNTCQNNENTEWTDVKIKDIALKEIIGDGYESEFPSKDTIEQISTSIHSLADQLPAFGTYKLDVLIGSGFLKNLSVSKESVLAGAFVRLTRWHSAHFTIFEQTKCDSDKLNEWCEITNAHILQQHSKLDLGPTLWRGAISANDADNTFYEGFELKLDIGNDYSISHSSKNDIKQVNSDHIVLSSKLQIINEVSFASIPPYLLPPVIFRLQLSRLNVLNEKSFRFLDYLLSNKEAALILKLEYAEINTKLKPERKYCTSRWQKSISSHRLKDPQCFISSCDKYISFAVTKSRCSDHIVAYPLQKENLDANFYFTIINQRVPSLPCQISEKICKEIDGIPLVNGDLFQETISKYKIQNGHHPQNAEHEEFPPVSNTDFSSLLKNIRNSISSSSQSVSCETVCSSDILLEEIDPSDWPERIQLLNKQMHRETKNCILTSIGQSLKLPQQSYSLSSDFITQYFLPSGEPKNLTNIEIVCQLNNDHPVTDDLSTVLDLKWPDVISCTYHDLYYNSSLQTEDKESLGSQMVKLYVQHETASTCNNQQITQNFSIIVPEKSSTPSKEFRSPSCRAANAMIRKRCELNNVSPRQNILKDLICSKILSSSRSFYGGNTSKLNDNVSNNKSKIDLNKDLVPVRCSPRKNNSVRRDLNKTSLAVRSSPRKKNPVRRDLNKTSFAVRSSPRKKNPVNYKYPSVPRNTTETKNGKKPAASNNMSDLLKKKIRYAVATALENNGINMTHDFFKPCGAKLFSICRTFVDDLTLKKGKTSDYLQKIADAHVKQVIEFYQS